MDQPTPASHRPSRRADARVLLDLARAALHPTRPVIAHLIVTRRCNLRCGYCFEYDRYSAPVPTEVLRERIDHLARLGTVMVTLTGGETLLHPDVAELVGYARERGMTPVMNSNGYLLTRERIEALNRAGLYALQLSIDNVEPNQTTRKSLRPLRPKLRLLAEHAQFRVRVNTVLGAGSPAETVTVAREVMALGFDAKCSLVRDAAGALIPLDAETRQAYDEICALGRRASSLLSEDFQLTLLRDGEIDWKCRAGARYFHVCEDGLVHYCSSNHGYPGIPLADYGPADLERASATAKPCSRTCTQAYAHQASRLDSLRAQPVAGEITPASAARAAAVVRQAA